MRRPNGSQIVGFVLASLAAGVALDMLGVTPLGFWEAAGERAMRAGRWLWTRADGLLLTILAGAVVIAPLYGAAWLIRRRRR